MQQAGNGMANSNDLSDLYSPSLRGSVVKKINHIGHGGTEKSILDF